MVISKKSMSLSQYIFLTSFVIWVYLIDKLICRHPFITPKIGTMNLFAYGTLQSHMTQRFVVGHEFEKGTKDTMTGYWTEKEYPSHIPVAVPCPGKILHGTLFTGLTEEDFVRMDKYEAGYDRMLLPLDSGKTAYVYIGRDFSIYPEHI